MNSTIDKTDLTDTYMKKREKHDQLNTCKEKAFDKSQHLFMIKKKTFRKSVYEQQIIGKYQYNEKKNPFTTVLKKQHILRNKSNKRHLRFPY